MTTDNSNAPTSSLPAHGGDSRSALPRLSDSWKTDLISGFLVFLIALPLCLGIAKASGFPPIAGVLTAVLGGIITGFFSNSELTIKGPAAGMIAIVLGAMVDFGYVQDGDAAINNRAYQFVLAVGVVAGVAQILFGLFRAGILADFCPMAPVHGLLASIGLIIISKQLHPVFGGKAPPLGPIECYKKIPDTILHMDPHVATIGLISLLIMFGYPWLKSRVAAVGKVPAQLIVLIVAIPLGQFFKLSADKLVNLPAKLSDAIVFPDFSRMTDTTSLKWIVMFALVGTLESMLSAKAIDVLDPWKRKTNMNRDVLGVGVANTVSSLLGGLPMISEILRSSANISNGARTRLSNAFHGMFLLLAILISGPLVKMIPLAALGAMLVFAGFRLASPKEFLHMWHVGKEQFLIFCLTIGFIIPEGHLLDGIFVGMGAELLINIINGAKLGKLFKPAVDVTSNAEAAQVVVHSPLIFSNWISFKRRIDTLDAAPKVTIDVAHARLIDHTAMGKLLELQRTFFESGRTLTLTGLDDFSPLGSDPTSARKGGRAS
jgi:MFS superfamily sulfate permease-like transporter